MFKSKNWDKIKIKNRSPVSHLKILTQFKITLHLKKWILAWITWVGYSFSSNLGFFDILPVQKPHGLFSDFKTWKWKIKEPQSNFANRKAKKSTIYWNTYLIFIFLSENVKKYDVCKNSKQTAAAPDSFVCRKNINTFPNDFGKCFFDF